MSLSSLPPYPTIVLLGDSITQQAVCPNGWATGLTNLYIRRMDIINRGFSGYNTSHIRRILPSILPPSIFPTLKLVTIFLGANDCVLPGQPQHVPEDEFEANLTKIVEYIREQKHQAIQMKKSGSSEKQEGNDGNEDKVCILFITPPPICEYKTQAHDRENNRNYIQRLSPRTAKYASIVRSLASTLKHKDGTNSGGNNNNNNNNDNNDIACCDLWTDFMLYAGYSASVQNKQIIGEMAMEQNMLLDGVLRDGLHLTEKGEEMVLKGILKTIADTWPEMDPVEMPFLYDSWEVAKRFGE